MGELWRDGAQFGPALGTERVSFPTSGLGRRTEVVCLGAKADPGSRQGRAAQFGPAPETEPVVLLSDGPPAKNAKKIWGEQFWENTF